MNYLLVGGVLLVGLLVLYQLFRRANLRKVVRALRWVAGGVAALVAIWLLLRGRIDIASIVGLGAASILRFGRLGPLVFGGDTPSDDNASEVRSHFIDMALDHGTGEVTGRVIAGSFKGADLIDLGEQDTRQLLAEVAGDPDSLSLLETWLDKNRTGWREYFAQQDAGAGTTGAIDPDAEAYEVLGLAPGATADEIREAHRNLMKRVHPDQGGSTYLASKINEAKDRLLKKVSG